MQQNRTKARVVGVILTIGLITVTGILFSRTAKTSGDRSIASIDGDGVFQGPFAINKELLSAQIGAAVAQNTFPVEFDLSLDGGTKKTSVEYSLDEKSQQFMEKTVGQYRPDYAAFVAIDARTGKILTMVSYSAVNGALSNLALQATFPAASLFKVVTASAAIDLHKAEASTVVPFNGANHTLYKSNVMDTKFNRWTRHMTMREAFARSVNTFFGKLGLFIVGPENLKTYAERFQFNHQIRADIPVQMGEAKFSMNDPWSVVSAASGFTRDNTMSPLQGAMMAAAISNDGVMMEPYLIESLKDENGLVMYEASPKQASVVVDREAAEELRELFSATVHSGTSRKSFRQTVRKASFDEVEFGGKTGSLTGLNPAGKCDWFIGYARYGGERVAVAALTVNEKKWRVKSATLASLFFTQYLKSALSSDQVARNSVSH
ncbi:MAG TPA: penicillin-binding transpeptidase domain-containing protein [Bdellovibrionales bacterium]|nr:penicillin-binding transpeptidase domain-containing protein [Bdellovibrionales bacterium]